MPSSLPLIAASALLGLATAQTPGDKPEVHPRLTTWECTKDVGCLEKNSAIVLDSLAHPIFQKDAPEYNCGSWGNAPNETACPDAETCQKNCIMQGVEDYTEYGIFTEGSALTLDMLSPDGEKELSPRVYLLSEDEKTYEMLQLTGKEFTFDVDVSKLPCGMNGALYLSEMPADGGLTELNEAGAYWGTGYCDAQCYTTPFISGEPNLEGYGACCPEMDIWEANSRAVHVAPHPCNKTGLFECEGVGCEYEGFCDEDGCAYNPWRFDNEASYGIGLEVDTRRPFTVISQYPADKDGNLIEYHRKYLQDGKLIDNGPVNISSLPQIDFLNDELCEATGAERYLDLGATKGMGEAMARGMVLAMSIWWDAGGGMMWLDGDNAGPCVEGEGLPENILKVESHPTVTFSNIKWGDIGTTFKDPSKCKKKKQN